MQWSGKLSELSKKKQKLQDKVKQLLEQQITADQDDNMELADGSKRARQIGKLKKQAERIDRWLKENDAKIGAQGKELQSNVTDNESAKMKTSHGTIQGYNGQALVAKCQDIDDPSLMVKSVRTSMTRQKNDRFNY
jgi:hypothetical protein